MFAWAAKSASLEPSVPSKILVGKAMLSPRSSLVSKGRHSSAACGALGTGGILVRRARFFYTRALVFFVDGLLASKEIVPDRFSRRILSQQTTVMVLRQAFLADFSYLPASVSSMIRSRCQRSTS